MFAMPVSYGAPAEVFVQCVQCAVCLPMYAAKCMASPFRKQLARMHCVHMCQESVVRVDKWNMWHTTC